MGFMNYKIQSRALSDLFHASGAKMPFNKEFYSLTETELDFSSAKKYFEVFVSKNIPLAVKRPDDKELGAKWDKYSNGKAQYEQILECPLTGRGQVYMISILMEKQKIPEFKAVRQAAIDGSDDKLVETGYITPQDIGSRGGNKEKGTEKEVPLTAEELKALSG